MSNIQDMLNANENYALEFKYAELKSKPLKKVAVLACMDTRLSIENILGLSIGEANIIRNAGGIATDDAIRSLIVSHHFLGTEKFIVINHTDCGMQKITDEDIRNNLRQKLNKDPNEIRFHTFANLEENVKEQVQKIKASPFLPQDISIYGFVYNTQTGRLKKIV